MALYPSFWSQEDVAKYERIITVRQEAGMDVPQPWWESNPEWGIGGQPPQLITVPELPEYPLAYVQTSRPGEPFAGYIEDRAVTTERVQVEAAARAALEQPQGISGASVLQQVRAMFGEVGTAWTDLEVLQVIIVFWILSQRLGGIFQRR